MKKALRSPVTYILLAGALLLVAVNVMRGGGHVDQLSLKAFTTDVADGKVASATLNDSSSRVTGRLKGPDGLAGDRYEATYPERYASTLTQQLLAHNVPEVSAKHSKGSI